MRYKCRYLSELPRVKVKWMINGPKEVTRITLTLLTVPP
jgi:hypothetical protein